MNFKAGDIATAQGERVEILCVEREPNGPVPGRYTVKCADGRTIENYPGYMLKRAP